MIHLIPYFCSLPRFCKWSKFGCGFYQLNADNVNDIKIHELDCQFQPALCLQCDGFVSTSLFQTHLIQAHSQNVNFKHDGIKEGQPLTYPVSSASYSFVYTLGPSLALSTDKKEELRVGQASHFFFSGSSASSVLSNQDFYLQAAKVNGFLYMFVFANLPKHKTPFWYKLRITKQVHCNYN